MISTDGTPYDDLTKRLSTKGLSTLLEVSSSLASTLDLAEVLQIAIESATDLLDVETGAIYMLENGGLVLGATTPPLPPKFPDELRVAKLKDHPHINRAISTRMPVHLEDARKAVLSPAEKSVVDARHLVSILYFPLLLKDDAIGAFIVGTNSEVHQFLKGEIDLGYILSFQVSLAISNARLYEEAQQAVIELNQAYDATLEGWSRMLDLRDHITEAHTHRVTDLTAALAEKMGIPEAEIMDIRRGAILHDIGKMAIPDTILQKPDVLSEEEWTIMKMHPEKAYQILSQIDYLAEAVQIPYCHHERWDGTGYPRGLKGEEIPIAARLFAVVDVFDALTSDRPYRKAWKRKDALNYLREQSGKYFFPQAVGAFLEMIDAEDDLI